MWKTRKTSCRVAFVVCRPSFTAIYWPVQMTSLQKKVLVFVSDRQRIVRHTTKRTHAVDGKACEVKIRLTNAQFDYPLLLPFIW